MPLKENTFPKVVCLLVVLLIRFVFFTSQFKSVIEEDDEDIDEDDVGDEELAQLVAMAKTHTESEDSDTETEAPEGERGAAVGSDSTSEASTNTPLHVSNSCFTGK